MSSLITNIWPQNADLDNDNSVEFFTFSPSFMKLQIPNSKIQGKFNNQTSSQPADATGWSLMLGVSLDFGDWILIV
jgi:hypothetical protein